MTTAAESMAQTDCVDLRRHNDELQRQNDILNGRVKRLNMVIVQRDETIDKQAAIIEALRNGEIDAQQLTY